MVFISGSTTNNARCRPARGNMKSALEHGDIVEKYISEEREAKRILGPFQRTNLQVSPLWDHPKI